MKNFNREYPLLSLCGLNCGLCTMHIGGYCPGCGGGDGNQSCAIARCSIGQGVAFCSDCAQYPCTHYDAIDATDSFISTRNMRENLEKVKRMGLDAYRAELDEKIEIAALLLAQYNDGRHKSPFCTAVNLLELARLRTVMDELRAQATDAMTQKEKAALAAAKLNAAAQEQGVCLKMRKKKQ